VTPLERTLIDLGFLELFERLDSRALDAAWREHGARALLALATDGGADPLARFLAAEVVLSKDASAASADDRRLLAPLYATALARQLGRTANQWSLPDGTLGRAGEHLVALGGPAASALRPLLDDDTRVVYEGSREATFGNAFRFRVKDLAALLIAKIEGRPFAAARDARERDAAIAKLNEAR